MYLTTKRNNSFQILLCVFISLFSLLVSLILLFDVNKPSYYSLLFLLPLLFSFFSVIFNKLYFEIPSNLGVSLIIILTFVRTVISPLLMFFGDYEGTITYRIDENTSYAILLVVYEMFCIFLLMYIMISKYNKSTKKENSEIIYSEKPIGMKLYALILLILILILFVCNYITPQLLSSYRTIFDITDENFTAFEDSYVTATYGTTFIKKLSLVTGFYLVRALIVIIPAFLIIKFSQKKTLLRKFLSICCCFIPFFFIGGAIAKSLIYFVCLFLLYNYLFYQSKFTKKSIVLFCFAGIIVIAWWIFRADWNDIAGQFSKRFSAYFSGVNVVSGVFNLPNSFEYKVRYFLYDFTSTFPYGGTIFNISHETVQPFFNYFNYSSGQIPPTVGMSCYYFGPILAPIYSIIFASIAINAGQQFKLRISGNPIRYIRLMLNIFTFSMGIIMYNIEITMTSFFSLLLPMYILERITYQKG